jgi:hypothetical protein
VDVRTNKHGVKSRRAARQPSVAVCHATA